MRHGCGRAPPAAAGGQRGRAAGAGGPRRGCRPARGRHRRPQASHPPPFLHLFTLVFFWRGGFASTHPPRSSSTPSPPVSHRFFSIRFSPSLCVPAPSTSHSHEYHTFSASFFDAPNCLPPPPPPPNCPPAPPASPRPAYGAGPLRRRQTASPGASSSSAGASPPSAATATANNCTALHQAAHQKKQQIDCC